MASRKIEIYDTTLRDGSQLEGISLSVDDRIRITGELDRLGVSFIEGGFPASNPKEAEFFGKVASLKLKNAKLVAFGGTRKVGAQTETDDNMKALLAANTPAVCLVGKSSDIQVQKVLETSLEENLSMIADSVSYLKGKGKIVIFDAEHFFDGYKRNPEYALRALQIAEKAGADRLVLCDTNGGTMPDEVFDIVTAVKKATKAPLAIHAHNDAELAVANSLAAIRAGAEQVQGTINGYGERCGNANLISVIANLKLKLGIDCISDEQVARLREISSRISDIVNIPLNPQQAYVGNSAFSHKAGYHVAGIAKMASSYQHIDPAAVGNDKKVLISELSGRSNILYIAKELGIELSPKGEEIRMLLQEVKERESRGFQYEGAEASFELLIRRSQKNYKRPFELVDFMVMVERHRRYGSNGSGGDKKDASIFTLDDKEALLSEATVKVRVGPEVFHTAAEGNGPVNALDQALRKALVQFYPSVANVKLTDYKVRIVDESSGTGSTVRVIIESSDGGSHQWRTMGCSQNIIEASWMALADSLEYSLVHAREALKR